MGACVKMSLSQIAKPVIFLCEFGKNTVVYFTLFYSVVVVLFYFTLFLDDHLTRLIK